MFPSICQYIDSFLQLPLLPQEVIGIECKTEKNKKFFYFFQKKFFTTIRNSILSTIFKFKCSDIYSVQTIYPCLFSVGDPRTKCTAHLKIPRHSRRAFYGTLSLGAPPLAPSSVKQSVLSSSISWSHIIDKCTYLIFWCISTQLKRNTKICN